MKNKHLVYLFLCVLALGLISRLLPFQYRQEIRRPLATIDTLAVSKIIISRATAADLLLQRTPLHWTATQDGRSALARGAQVQMLLQLLSALNSCTVKPGAVPEQLGFAPAEAIKLQISQAGKLPETLILGAEYADSGSVRTYVRIPENKSTFTVKGALRTGFALELSDFRSKEILPQNLKELRKISILRPGRPPVFWARNDSTDIWLSPNGTGPMAMETVRAWLQLLRQLPAEFSDSFDETRADETLHTTLHFTLGSGAGFSLRFFYQKPPELPEDYRPNPASRQQLTAAYVFHSSLNPLNYFALNDTLLARRICSGLLPAFTPAAQPLQRDEHDR